MALFFFFCPLFFPACAVALCASTYSLSKPASQEPVSSPSLPQSCFKPLLHLILEKPPEIVQMERHVHYNLKGQAQNLFPAVGEIDSRLSPNMLLVLHLPHVYVCEQLGSVSLHKTVVRLYSGHYLIGAIAGVPHGWGGISESSSAGLSDLSWIWDCELSFQNI